MKKLLVAILLGAMAGVSYSACIGPYCYDDTNAWVEGLTFKWGSSLSVTGAASMLSTLAVTGAATLSSTLGVTDTITASKGISASTATVTGTATLSGGASISTMTLTAVSSVAGTPSAAGKIVVNSAYVVYVSTCATDAGCWVKVGAQ